MLKRDTVVISERYYRDVLEKRYEGIPSRYRKY